MASRKRRAAARLGATAVLATGMAAVLALPATAGSGAPVTPAGDDDPMIQAMQRDLGMSAQEAEQRLRSEAAAFRADETVRATLDSFGGSYYDAELGKLVVGVTDKAEFDEVRAAGAQPRSVDNSRSELDAVVEQLNEADDNVPESVATWYADVKSNSVMLTTALGTTRKANEFVESAGVDQADVTVVESTEDPKTLMDIIGGNAYYNDSTGGRCSVGFSVYGGFVTAGHCGDYGDYTSQPSGYFAGSSFPGDDYAYVDAGSDDTPKPWVNMYNGYARVVQGSAEAPVGSSVCRSGSTTGWHCGYIEAKDQTVSYPQGTVYGLTKTDVCAEPGDSGGSFISGNEAQGMTSGGSGDCTYGGTTYFQPVNEVLNAYGLTLVTG
ncbi:S1 family peptidase [Saccharomonospora halophila]|uniref:S1 family peptidase n=1 Tax=Saccharomonospora halophila TaxID=129922 RepID=UPI00048A7FE1|nr:S1 family peptidase [Saccharomonospora halophila]